jgi:hypothetical protein
METNKKNGRRHTGAKRLQQDKKQPNVAVSPSGKPSVEYWIAATRAHST